MSDSDTHGEQESESSGVPNENTHAEIERVADDFLLGLMKRESPDYMDLVNQNPHLAPWLEKRLLFYLNAVQVKPAKSEPSEVETADLSLTSLYSPLANPIAFHVKCPHCGNQVQIVDNHLQEVTCTTCGSSVPVSSRASSKGNGRIARPMPDKLGHFRILRVLGEGGFGVVYLGEDLQLDMRRVAVKIPRHGYFASREEEQRFFREATNVARLRHPNIAQVYEVSEGSPIPYIVSEFINGITLRELLATGTLSHSECVKLVIQIAEAIDFAHSKKIIHRDLKSSNILVDSDKKAYVVDFGLSRRDDAEITMTVDGAIIGTVQYMSPEQAVGNQADVGPWSDVYSLGVILYELLCKELPFSGSKRMVIEQVINQEPPSPHRLNDSVPRDLETITLKAMSKDPKQRYLSAQEFADDLRRWLRGEPIHARPISSVARFWSWCRRHPTIASLSATIAALLLIVTALSVWSALEQWRLNAIAIAAQRDSEQQHHDLLMQNGTSALAGNDLPTATLWFSEALQLRESPSNRTRIGMIQDRIPKLTALYTTEFPISTVHYDSSGTRLIVADFEGHVQVYNTVTNKKIFQCDTEPFTHIRTSSTGNRIALCGTENHAELWNVDDGSLIKKLPHTGFVVSTAFHPLGQSLATGGFDSYARVWNTADGSLRAEHKFDGMEVTQVAFVPESSLVLVVARVQEPFKNVIHLWDFENDTIVADGMPHDSHILRVEFAEQGKHICSASLDGQIRVWDTAGKAIGNGIKLPFAPRDMLFGGSSAEVLSISHDSDLQVWRLSDGQRVGPEIRGLSHYESVAQDPSNRLIAVGQGDGSVRVFWRKTGAPACTLLKNSESATAISFHSDGRRLVIGGKNGVLQVWDLAGSVPTSHVFKHQDKVRNALFSPDGKRCYTVGLDGKAFIWNALTGQQMGEGLDHGAAISNAVLSQDGSKLATAGLDGRVKLWEARTGERIGDDFVHESELLALAISPDGQTLVTGTHDGTVTGWAIKLDKPGSTSAPLFTAKHANRVKHVTYNTAGNIAASASLDGTVRCWDMATGREVFGPFVHAPSALYCAFMPDGSRLLSTGTNGQVILWDLKSGKVLNKLECSGEVLSALVVDDETIWTNESKGRTRGWKLYDNDMLLESETHQPGIESVAYCDVDRQHGRLAFAGGTFAQAPDIPQSGAAALWDYSDKRYLAPLLSHLAPVRYVYFNNSGTQLLTASDDNTARLWSIVTTELLPADVVRIAQLYAQTTRRADGRIEVMSPEMQLTSFAALSKDFSDYFHCNAKEIELWNAEVSRMHAAQ